MTSLDPVFKIGNQMVEMICAHQDISKKEARAMAVEALKKVGIPQPEKRMDSYPYELSGGMCQRVIIAMAVCCKPKMIKSLPMNLPQPWMLRCRRRCWSFFRSCRKR